MPFLPTPVERKNAHRAGSSMGSFKRELQAEINYNNNASVYTLMQSSLPAVTGVALVDSTIYWVHVGRAQQQITFNQILVQMASGVAGTAAVAIATTDLPPQRGMTNATLTVRAVQPITLVNATLVTNAVALGYAPIVTENLWLALRVSGGTPVATTSLTHDFNVGRILSTTAGAALAINTTYLGVPFAHVNTTGQCPELALSTV